MEHEKIPMHNLAYYQWMGEAASLVTVFSLPPTRI
jgi:hypothetical protein